MYYVRTESQVDVQERQGWLRVGQAIDALMSPYKGATGQTTTLNKSIFATMRATRAARPVTRDLGERG